MPAVTLEQPTVRRLVLERFRSITSASITFDNPTIFVGRNGSGKSNLVSAFSFLADAMTAPLHAVFERSGGLSAVRNRSSRGGPPTRLGMRVELTEPYGGGQHASYAFEIKSLPNHGFLVSREQCVAVDGSRRFWFDRRGEQFHSNIEERLQPPLQDASLVLPAISGYKPFWRVWEVLSRLRVYAIDPGELRRMREPDPGLALRRNGANVASVLREIENRLPEKFDRIARVLATIVPNLDGVAVKTRGKYLALQFTQRWGTNLQKQLRCDASDMSDGTLRALGIVTALFQDEWPALIAVEEPEATIHPGALESILDVVRAASERVQIVMTTHSPELLDAKWIADRHLRMVDWHAGATHVAPVSDANRTALRDRLMGAGELLRANALESAPTIGNDAPRARLFESVR